ncbi:MAG: hypothetical protein WBP61_13190 [Nocardioides sp.]
MPSTARTRLIVVATLVVALGVAVAVALVVTSRPDHSPAPATKQALAAVTVDVLDIEPSSYNVNPQWDVPEPLGVELRWHPGGDHDAHLLHVRVAEAGDDARGENVDGPCPRFYDCARWRGDDGAFRLRWQEESPEEDPGILTLSYATAGEVRSVTYAGQELQGDPRRQADLPVSIDDLERLLTDPRLSATTTQAMVDTDLAKWPEPDDTGDAVPTTSEEVAQWLDLDAVTRPEDGGSPADVSDYADGSIGVTLRSPDRVTTVVLVPADADEVPTCPDGWHCRTQNGWPGPVVTGWRPGEAIAIRTSDDAIVYGSVRSDTIDRLPRPEWEFGKVGQDYAALENGFSAMNLVTTRLFADDPGPDWFHQSQE